MPNRLSLKDQKFGSLLVKEFAYVKGGCSYWLCQCDCGKTPVMRGSSLNCNRVQSCGCVNPWVKDRRTRSKSYRVWMNMIQRCTNPKHIGWKWYGGKGVTICAEWMDFAVFFRDMGERPQGLQIERVNNDLPYCKTNCRWATPAEQCRNRTTNRVFTVNGFTGCVTDIADYFGILRSRLWNRLHCGWSIERAVNEPIHAEKGPKH